MTDFKIKNPSRHVGPLKMHIYLCFGFCLSTGLVVCSDLFPADPDPFTGVGPAEPGGGTEPGQSGPEQTAAGGESAGAEPAGWQDPAGDHHQVIKGHSGRDKPGNSLQQLHSERRRLPLSHALLSQVKV